MAFKLVRDDETLTWICRDDPGVQIDYRRLSQTELARIVGRHTTWKRGRQVTDDTALTQEVLARMVIRWRGVLGQDGRPVAFAPDLVPQAMSLLAEFIEEVTQLRAQLAGHDPGPGAAGAGGDGHLGNS